MGGPSSNEQPSHGLAGVEQIARLRAQFESECKTAAADAPLPSLDSYLDQIEAPFREMLLIDLVRIRGNYENERSLTAQLSGLSS
jgi:hypothetical protein